MESLPIFSTTISELRQLRKAVATRKYVTPDGRFWMLDPTDTVTSDNTGTVLVNATGQRLKAVLPNKQINVMDFGATGNGTTDDTTAIQVAANYAIANKKTLFFPSGTYLINTQNSTGKSIVCNGIGNNPKIELLGEVGAIITTNLTGDSVSRPANSLFTFYFDFSSVKISNIIFINTHGITTYQSTAIFFIGGSPTGSSENVLIEGCSFTGFGGSIVCNGTVNPIINNCQFFSPLGHDNAKNNAEPAVHVNFTSNSNGDNTNIIVTNCYAEGCADNTDLANTVTKKAMDGFIYGNPHGITISNNTMRNFSEEAILLQPDTTSGNVAVISSNNFNYKNPYGSNNYGIRAEGNNIEISGNYIYNSNNSIFVYNIDLALQTKNLSVYNNIISVSSSVKAAITVYGNVTYKIKGVSVVNNSITIDGVSQTATINLIRFAYVDGLTVDKNVMYLSNNVANGFDLNLYSFINSNNSCSVYPGNIVGSYSNLYSLSGSNTNFKYLTDYRPSKIIGSGLQVINTATSGNVNTEIVMFTGVIPGNTLGPNSTLKCILLGTMTNSTNSKIFKVRVNGIPFGQASIAAAAATGKWLFTMTNRNSLTNQVLASLGSPANNSFGTTIGVLVLPAINFAIDQTFTITTQVATVGEFAAIEAFELSYEF